MSLTESTFRIKSVSRTEVTTGRKPVGLEFNRGLRTASPWPTRISFNRWQEFGRVPSPPPPAVGRSPLAAC